MQVRVLPRAPFFSLVPVCEGREAQATSAGSAPDQTTFLSEHGQVARRDFAKVETRVRSPLLAPSDAESRQAGCNHLRVVRVRVPRAASVAL